MAKLRTRRPPIQNAARLLNDVEAYTGVTAVNAYFETTQLSETEGFEYGGGHAIEDIIRGREIENRGTLEETKSCPITQTLFDVNYVIKCDKSIVKL